ncbi:MAG: TolC family protein [Muribaculaceae bacterium]|nr:TolC family protein [Muribaculaceae bacterium]
MNFFLRMLAPAILSVWPAADSLGAPADTLRISREKCIEIALNDNPSVKVADLEVKKTDYARKELEGSLFPSIDFSLAYQRSIELQSMNMNMGGQSTTIKMGTDNNWNTGFSASMPLVNASLWKSIQISETQILAALEEARGSRIDLVNNINKAYYAMLLAIASRDVIRQNYDIAVINAEIYRKQFEQGTASEYDVLRSSVQVSNIEPELLQADIAIRQCALQLKVLMGIESETPLWPDITLRDMQREMYGLGAGFDKNISRNTSLRALDIQTRALEQNVTLKKFAWIPTLGVQFNINWNAMSNGNAFKNQKFNPYSNVALALNIPIFSGGSKYNALKQAEVQLAEMKFQREYLESNLNMQVELAIDNINKQVRQIASSEQGVKQARKAHEIMQKSFEIGAATYLDLRDSELADTSAQLAYLQAIYNYLVSTSELDALLGKEGLSATATLKQ